MLFALLRCTMADPGREAAMRWKPQTKGSTELQDNFLPQGGVSDPGQRNSKSGFSDAQRHPGMPSCPETVCCGQPNLPLCCLARMQATPEQSRQAVALGMVPRKLHLCRFLSNQRPAGATSPAHPCQQHQLCCNGSGSRGETRNLHLAFTSLPLPAEHQGLATPGMCSAAICLHTPSTPTSQPPALLQPNAYRKGSNTSR